MDKQIEQLEKEQREKMKMWSRKTEPLATWLVKKEIVVESYEPIGYDISYVKRQSEDAQVGADSFFYLVLHFLYSRSLVIDMKVPPVHGIPHRERKLCEKFLNKMSKYSYSVCFSGDDHRPTSRAAQVR